MEMKIAVNLAIFCEIHGMEDIILHSYMFCNVHLYSFVVYQRGCSC